MKKLYIVRHAKSSWDYDLDDHERPLNKRGVNDANLIGNYLQNIVKSIDRVKTSDAVRAKTTADIITGYLDIEADIYKVEPRLYNFSGEEVIKVIKETEDTVNTLMIFGHNHALTDIHNKFGTEMIDNLPTAGVSMIQFETKHWSDISVGKNLLTVFPKQLR